MRRRGNQDRALSGQREGDVRRRRSRLNDEIAARLDEVAGLLEAHGAEVHRVGAFRRAAETLRALDVSVGDLLAAGGVARIETLPAIGPFLGRAIRDLAATGRLAMLDRLRAESDPERLLMTVPGIGSRTAARIHHDLGIGTLEDLETAAHDGRLAALPGIGRKRLRGIRDALAGRLARVRPARTIGGEAPVSDLLAVDREYRDRSVANDLRRIAPRRFNPHREAWLPILHTERGGHSYTALYSNTERAHRLGTTHDWVILYYDGDGREHQATVVTARQGALEGNRIVRGREAECARHYGLTYP